MRRYRIFISSTIDDLQDARASLDEELTATHTFEAIRVENFPAVEEPSRTVCLEEVADADGLVLILGDRYGFVPETNNPENLSVTHLEYREAKRLGKPIFAFLREGVNPEPKLLDFISEISSFSEGVLRKKWDSTEQLKSEVLRALVYWLGRQARENPSPEMRQQFAEQMAQYPDLGKVPLFYDITDTSNGKLRNWLNAVVQQLSLECEQRLLPLPHSLGELQEEPKSLSLVLRTRPSGVQGRLLITVSLVRKKGAENLKGPLPPAIELDAAQTPEGARFTAHTSLALVFITADDWSRSIDQLFTAAASRNATDSSRAHLLATAAYISAINLGQRSFEVVRQLLKLPRLDIQTVSAGIMALMAAILRLEHARARHALAVAERLTLRLLTLALSQDPAASETLYNLARQFMKHSSGMALKFYSELLRKDSSYDERWYFHRDLGLIYYGLNKYREAAHHYDLACHLKSNDSELFRFAGDAYYYWGYWAEALIRYEKAIQVEPIERYFLNEKIDFTRSRIHKRVDREPQFSRKRKVSHWISRMAVKAAESRMKWIGRPLFRIARKICDVNFDADKWLALYANRKGAYGEAITHLKSALAAVPEDPSVRLNLVVNMIFQSKGQFVGEALRQAEIAIFHGGPETRNQFRVRLTNTEKCDYLCEQFEEIFNAVKRKHDEWRERRREVLKPEKFGEAIHFEFR